MKNDRFIIPSIELYNAKLGISMCPGRCLAYFNEERDLDEDLSVIKDEDYNTAVCFLEDDEISSFSPGLIDGYKRYEIDLIRYPISDMSVSSDMESYIRLVTKLVEILDGGKNVFVHCFWSDKRSAFHLLPKVALFLLREKF